MKILYEEVPLPLSGPPAGAEAVDRWYQLDPASLSLVEFWSRQLRHLPRPDAILLASPHASNESDERFFESGLSSPQRFVHTLPNVRSAPLCQLLQWRGPMLCVQRDPLTFSTALEEGERWLAPDRRQVWVLGVQKLDLNRYGVLLFGLTFGGESSSNHWLGLPDAEIWTRAAGLVGKA